MDFTQLFKDATILTADFLKNEFGLNLGMPAEIEQAKFKDYYLTTCEYIREHYYLEPTNTQIEAYLLTGTYTYDTEHVVTCAITDETMRKYIFLHAQAKQLLYDKLGGRGAMLRGEDKQFNVCPDFVNDIKMLGLYQRHYAII